MTSRARLLPLLSVAAWTITLALPILSSGNSDGTRIVVSSTGGHPFSLTGTQPEFLVAWAAVLGCAASVWLLRSIKWWSVVAILVAVLLSALLITTLMNPPELIWDGVDEQGRGIGGYVVGKPAAGVVVWIIGIAALFAAGVQGLVEQTRRDRND